MIRTLFLLLIVSLFLLAQPVSAAAPTVKNPMAADLDGGGYNISNVTNFTTRDGAVLGGTSFMVIEGVYVDNLTSFNAATVIKAGTANPSVAGVDLNPGSIYMRRVGGTPGQPWTGSGELWFKYGPASTDWLKVAP